MKYRRCQGKSFMIREAGEPVTGYQLPMLRENRIFGILPMHQVQEGQGISYWYDISGANDLEGYARFHKLGRAFLENFIVSLHRVTQNLGEFLLLEDGLCLDPNMVYLKNNEKDIYFCYVPESQKKLEKSLQEFMDYFLKHMEHGVQKDLEICYEIYEKSQTEHVSLLELVELVLQNTSEGGMESDFAKPEEMRDETRPQEEKRDHDGKKTGHRDRRENNGKKKNHREKWVNNGKKREYGIKWEKIEKKILPKILLKNKIEEKSEFVFEPEEFVEETANPTVFLGSESKEILGELRYEGDGTGSNFILDMPVFLIGSQEEEVNGLIRTSSVSRRHAAVYKEEGNYYIEDLNSTNGTYLNGEALEYKEKVLLTKNDKVKFAGEAYRFV